MSIRVLVVDDFPLVREGLSAALESSEGIEVVGCAENGLAGLRMAHKHKPDVILLDINMPDFGGMVLLERLRGELPDVRVLMVTASERADSLLDAVAAGAAGYLTKRTSREELCEAIRTVHGGGSVITPSLAGHLLREYSQTARGEPTTERSELTPRERDVLRLVAQGLTDREIGERLHISVRTVQNQLTAIREKTGFRRRSELTRWAVENAMT